jgi:hypothetical protein
MLLYYSLLPWKFVYCPIAQQQSPLLVPLFLLSAVRQQYVTLLFFCLGHFLQNAELSKESQAAATTKEGEVKSGSQTSITICGANGSTGMLIMYQIFFYF